MVKRGELRRRLTKKFTVLLLFHMMLFALAPAFAYAEGETAQQPVANGPALEASSAILMDAATGQILYEMNADVALPPASMSKMMTEYLVMEEIKKGKLTWQTEVTTQENAATTAKGGSRIFLAEGDKHTVEELFIAMAVGSANDASIALAEYVAGSEEQFAHRMNEKAKELGMTTAHFINATGLSRKDLSDKFKPSTIDGETVMSAKDSAILAYSILRDHPEFLKYSSIPSYKFRERDQKPMINYDWMLEANKNVPNFKKYAYDGLDGMKTGHTEEAQYCFTGTAQRDGMRLISVIMGAKSEPKRFLETRKLLDYGFSSFEKKTVLSAKSELKELTAVDVKKGVETSVPVVTESGISLIVKKGQPFEMKITAAPLEEDKRIAPLPSGSVVGTAKVEYKDANGKTQEQTVNLVTVQEVEKASWWRMLFRAIGDFFSDLFNGIKNLF